MGATSCNDWRRFNRLIRAKVVYNLSVDIWELRHKIHHTIYPFVKIFLLDSHTLVSSLFSNLLSQVSHLGHTFGKRILLKCTLDLFPTFDNKQILVVSNVSHGVVVANFLVCNSVIFLFLIRQHLDFSI